MGFLDLAFGYQPLGEQHGGSSCQIDQIVFRDVR